MPVTTSSNKTTPQAGGLVRVIETHLCSNAPSVVVTYLVPVGYDVAAAMAARVSDINAYLAEAEADANIATTAVSVNEQTAAEFAARLRQRYKDSDKADTCRIAYWLTQRIASGQITNAQCQAAFGVTATQWTNFKTTTLTPQSNAWASIIAATGS